MVDDLLLVLCLERIIECIAIESPIAQEIHLVIGMVPSVGHVLRVVIGIFRRTANDVHRPHHVFEIAMLVHQLKCFCLVFLLFGEMIGGLQHGHNVGRV
ncbi:hypothetical protein D3C86_1869120 [compost metagenome]